MHPLLACLCNSRIVQPAHAGDAPSWPLLLLWGGFAAAAVAGAVFWLVRRRRGRLAADESWELTAAFVGGPDAAGSDDPVAAGSSEGHVDEDRVRPPGVAAGPIQR